jgi:hypothetical protein
MHMTSRIDGADDLARAADSLKSRPEAKGASTYEISSALAMPSRRRLMGRWEVVEHLIGGLNFLDCFVAQQLKGAELVDGAYVASYEFRENLCIKKVCIDGLIPSEEGELRYEYRLTVALSWRPSQGKTLIVRPEIGYQLTMLDAKPAACKDLLVSGEEQRLLWRFEGKELILEEGDDRRILRRVQA